MGLFDKLFKSAPAPTPQDTAFDEDFETLRRYAKHLFEYSLYLPPKRQTIKDVLIVCDEFIRVASQIDARRASNKIRGEAQRAKEPGDIYPYHKDFHVTSFGDGKEWEKVIKDAKRIQSRAMHFVQFDKMASQIPEATISIDPDAETIKPKLSDMPELKYATVTKSFSTNKLVSFVVIDTETTGLKASFDKIIQLSAVRYEEWDPVEKWTTYINPKKAISEEATKVNGITEDMLVDKPTINQVLRSFEEFLGNDALVGYNLPFDIKFLYMAGMDLTKVKRKYYDVLPLAQKAYKKDDLDSFKLSSVARENNIYYYEHDSLQDCLATGAVFKKIVDRIVYR